MKPDSFKKFFKEHFDCSFEQVDSLLAKVDITYQNSALHMEAFCQYLAKIHFFLNMPDR
jgi:hypothetical protein